MIIDSHCHLHDLAFTDLRETLRTALAHDVWGVVAVGCDASTNARTLAAAAAAPKRGGACLGSPPEWPQLTDEDLDLVTTQLEAHQGRIVGLGGVGLPWYSLEGGGDAAALMTRGRARLDRLLQLACRWDLPVALHAPHGAAVGALAALKARGIERAVFHWHKAPADVTRAIVEAGYYVSVTPEVVYRDRDREMVAWVPLDSLLVESDGPWEYGGEVEGVPSRAWVARRVAAGIAQLQQ